MGASNSFALYHIHAALEGGERIEGGVTNVFLISAPGIQIFRELTVSFILF